MKKKDIKYFEQMLNDQLEELLSQADDTVTGMTAPKENFPDPTDRASLEADRIEDGTFGTCEGCGEDISFKRLKARPVTTQCIDCKTKEEALEKALGL